MVTSK